MTAKFESISYFGPDSVPHFVDDLCLVNLLKASCLKWMDSPLQAEECLRTVVGNAAKLEVKFKINSNMCTWKIEIVVLFQVDTYLAPYSHFELAVLLKEQGQAEQAAEMLEAAK